MKTFGTQGPVNPDENYVVSRTEEIADFVDRVKKANTSFSSHRDRPEKQPSSALL